MIPEVAEYIASIDQRFALICGVLDALTPEQLNARPPVADANSAWVLAQHALGNARAWVLGIAAGQQIERDRPGECASSGSDAAAFRAATRRFSGEMAAALAGITDADLDRRLVPSKLHWGEHEPREISVRGALVQVIEHASLHLGHLEVTRDVLQARR